MNKATERLPDYIHLYDPAQFGATELEKALATLKNESPVVTLILPMEQAGAETRKNPIVFKNALKEAREEVTSEPLSNKLGDLEEIADDSHDFWQHQNKGLLMVISSQNEVHAFPLAKTPEKIVHIGPHPRLLPLLTNLEPESTYVVALDLNETRLFSVTADHVEQVELESVPKSLDEAMKYDDPEESLQFRAASRSSGKDNTSVAYHGQGGTGDEEKNRQVDRFFEMVDKNLASHFSNQNTPLYLLGPGDLVGRYRNANSYPHLKDFSIDQNPSSMNDEELRDALISIATYHDDNSRGDEAERLGQHIADKTGSRSEEEITVAAMSGRIDTLFVDESKQIFGNVDTKTFATESCSEDAEGAVDIVDLSARKTVLSGGTVRASKKEDILDGSAMAAIFRY